MYQQPINPYSPFKGESPQEFMKRLASEYPERKDLQELDFNNLYSSAQKLYSQKGEDMNKVSEMITKQILNLH